MMYPCSGARRSGKCLKKMLSDEEIDWIEDRIYTLLEKLIETSEDKRAVEIRELLEIMNENVRKQRT